MELRPYQREAVEAVYEFLRARDDHPCVVIPTAGGKTPVIARGPLVTVSPDPAISPFVQVAAPLTVSVPEPVRMPPLRASVPVVPLAVKLAVPPVTVVPPAL